MTTANERRQGWLLRLVGIAVIVIVPYLPVWRQLGIYWDDVLFLGIAELRGRDELLASLSIDRPLLGVSFAALWQLIGMQVWQYHLVMIVLRGVFALLTAVLADELQPQQPALGTTAGLLAAAYPGFLQYATAYVYASTLIALVLYSLSLAATLWALRAATRRSALLLHLLSAVTVLFAVGLLEYLIGFELVRLLLVFLLQRPQGRSGWLRLLGTLALPWAIVALVIGWRLLFFASTREVTDVNHSVLRPLLNDPLSWLRRFARRLILSPLKAVAAWLLIPWGLVSGGSRQALLDWLVPLMLLLLVPALGLVRRRPRDGERAGAVSFLSLALVLGAGLVAVNLPIALAGRELVLFGGFDRYALPLIPLLAVLTALLLQRLPHPVAVSLTLVLLLVGGLSHATVFQQYARDWQRNQSLWQQLTLRKPTLDRGAVILLDRPIDRQRLVQQAPWALWSMANQVYPGDREQWEVAGWPIQAKNPPAMLLGRIGQLSTRLQEVQGDPAYTLVVAQPVRGCVRVITPALRQLPPELSDEGQQVVEARFAPTWPQPDGPAVQLAADLPAWLGRADAASWCGLLAQAELAEEQGDEATLAQLTETVLARGLVPADVREWRVYAEYLLRAGRSDAAAQLLTRLRTDPDAAAVCAWWRAVGGVTACDG